jgi:hypothetical protein
MRTHHEIGHKLILSHYKPVYPLKCVCFSKYEMKSYCFIFSQNLNFFRVKYKFPAVLLAGLVLVNTENNDYYLMGYGALQSCRWLLTFRREESVPSSG